MGLARLLTRVCEKVDYHPITGKKFKSKNDDVNNRQMQAEVKKLIHKSMKPLIQKEAQKIVREEIGNFFKSKRNSGTSSLAKERLEEILQNSAQSTKKASLEDLNDVLVHYDSYYSYLKKQGNKDSLKKLENLHNLAKKVNELGNELLKFTCILHISSDEYKDITEREMEVAYEKTPLKFARYVNWETELDAETFKNIRSQSDLIIEYILNEPIYLLNKRKAIYSLITGKQYILSKQESGESEISTSRYRQNSTNTTESLPSQQKAANRLVDALYEKINRDEALKLSPKEEKEIVNNLSYVINALVEDSCFMSKRSDAIEVLRILPKIFDNTKDEFKPNKAQ